MRTIKPFRPVAKIGPTAAAQSHHTSEFFPPLPLPPPFPPLIHLILHPYTAPSAPYPTQNRRNALLSQLALFSITTTTSSTLAALPALAAKTPKGFVPVVDQQDAYSFVYPFGWQEVSVDGLDVVYKDIIEPLEAVSVSMVPTDKKDILEYGNPKEVAYTLADRVLTGPTQEVQLVDATVREGAGRKYIDFEFLAKSRGYTKHTLASVTIGNGKLYTLETGSNERRWGKMREKVTSVVKSFEVTDRF